jgi:hypothetical protein
MMIWMGLLWLLSVLGFAYILWILASKEGGNIKLVGQLLAIGIALVALIVAIYCSITCGQGRQCGMMGPDKMEMMQKMMKK